MKNLSESIAEAAINAANKVFASSSEGDIVYIIETAISDVVSEVLLDVGEVISGKLSER